MPENLVSKLQDLDALSAINAGDPESKPAKSALNKSFEYTARSISTAGAAKYFKIVKGRVSTVPNNETDSFMDNSLAEKRA